MGIKREYPSVAIDATEGANCGEQFGSKAGVVEADLRQIAVQHFPRRLTGIFIDNPEIRRREPVRFLTMTIGTAHVAAHGMGDAHVVVGDKSPVAGVGVGQRRFRKPQATSDITGTEGLRRGSG